MQSFSTSQSRLADVAKLTLVGRLGSEPTEKRVSGLCYNSSSKMKGEFEHLEGRKEGCAGRDWIDGELSVCCWVGVEEWDVRFCGRR